MDDNNVPQHLYLHAYCFKPGIHFEQQDEDEEIILKLRAHPITQIPWLINGLILFIVLFFVDWAFSKSLTPDQLLIINLLSGVLVLSYLWFNFLSYYFNVGLITNKRIIDMDYQSVMFREISETNFDKIEDVTSISGGYIASLFNFGDVIVQTAGTSANIQFIKVPKSQDVVTIINHLSK